MSQNFLQEISFQKIHKRKQIIGQKKETNKLNFRQNNILLYFVRSFRETRNKMIDFNSKGPQRGPYRDVLLGP
jgi:hypothetical protein